MMNLREGVLYAALGTIFGCSPALSIADFDSNVEKLRREAGELVGQREYNSLIGNILERYVARIDKPTMREMCSALGLLHLLAIEYHMQEEGFRYSLESEEWQKVRNVPSREHHLTRKDELRDSLQRLLLGDCRMLLRL